jgi:hypothetical protein
LNVFIGSKSTHCFDIINFISECFAAGVDVKKLQLWVGHVDIGTTLNIYTKLSREVINDGNEMNHFYGSQTCKEEKQNLLTTVFNPLPALENKALLYDFIVLKLYC